jgi:hypothetical protein
MKFTFQLRNTIYIEQSMHGHIQHLFYSKSRIEKETQI